MKMQNTEMKIVTFDAQDVITTSSPVPTPVPTTISFLMTGSLFDLEDGWTYTDEDSVYHWKNDKDNTFYIYSGGVPLSDGEYYTIAKGAMYNNEFDNDYGSLYFDSGLTNKNTGTLYTSLREILGWLGENGAQ